MKLYKIKNIQDRRSCVTAINKFDKLNGIPTSQQAKYEHPVWWFVLSVLTGSDKTGMTVADIQTALTPFGVHYPSEAIKRGLRLMENPSYFVHPHIRGCGGALVNVMNSLGQLHRSSNWGPGNPITYWLGRNTEVVKIRRQIFGIKLK